MLGIIGIMLLIISFVMTIIFIVHMSRPKADSVVKEVFFKKLTSDVFQMGPERKHVKVTFRTQDGQDIETELPLLTKKLTKEGDIIKLSYKASNPKVVRYSDTKRELLSIIIAFLIGAIITTLSFVISGWLQG